MAIICFAALLSVAGAAEQKAPAAQDLEWITIRSTRSPSGAVTLRNGEYRGPAAPGPAAEVVVKLTDHRVFGAVNGRDAAAVVIVTDPGGSGTFFDLALLLKGDRGWANADTVLLGDRIKVHSIGMKDNEITVQMTSHGPGDALCCPTQETARRFRVGNDRLIAQSDDRKENGGAQTIVGPVWQWVRTRYQNDTSPAPPSGAPGYTMQLKQDGTVRVRGDCNRAGGTFILNGSSLAVTISHSTRAACPEGSLEDVYLRDLNRTNGWLLKNGRLSLDLRLDSGTMEFLEIEAGAGK